MAFTSSNQQKRVKNDTIGPKMLKSMKSGRKRSKIAKTIKKSRPAANLTKRGFCDIAPRLCV
eukprot:2954482-Lingulodinium_polyedra.AAC.1